MSYYVIDLETTSTRDPERGLHPYGKNQIVLIGWMNETTPLTVAVQAYDPEYSLVLSQKEELVGCNLAFDVGFLLSKNQVQPEHLPDVFWDVSIYQYLLLDHERFPSLNQIAEYWLGKDHQKSADIGELIKQYGDTDLIPNQVLVPYLKQDVLLTEAVYLAQKEHLEQADPDWVFLVASEFAACKENILATHRGIPLNMQELDHEEQALSGSITFLEGTFDGTVNSILSLPDFYPDQLINSRSFCQSLLYDPVVSVPGKLLTGEFKSGLKKGQKKYTRHTASVMLQGNLLDTLKGKSTDETVLNEYLSANAPSSGSDRYQLISYILQYRSLLKNLNTYCVNLRKYQVNGILHPTYQQTSTATGRISSSKPNIQNQP